MIIVLVLFLANVKFYFWVDKLKTKMLIMYCKQIKYLPNTHISATSGQNKKNNYHHAENTKHRENQIWKTFIELLSVSAIFPDSHYCPFFTRTHSAFHLISNCQLR